MEVQKFPGNRKRKALNFDIFGTRKLSPIDKIVHQLNSSPCQKPSPFEGE